MTKIRLILAGAMLLGTASVALADATEDYSNYPLANAYKYCARGNAFSCQEARRMNPQGNAWSAFGSTIYPGTPAPVQRPRHRTR